MPSPTKQDERIAQLTFDVLYPLYRHKVERKGRTEEELQKVLTWLTGFTKAQLQKQVDKRSTMEQFFAKAKLNPKASTITGSVCGIKVQDIENPLTQKARYMDKLVDELARGKKLESILRS